MQEIWMPALGQYIGRRGETIRVIVLHSTESGEGTPTRGGAPGVARYFATVRRGSTQLVIDGTDIRYRCVADKDTCWGAVGVNRSGLHIEQCGYAAQTREQWLDDASRRIVVNSAYAAAAWCRAYQIPPVRLSDGELAAGHKGVISHAQAWRVYGGDYRSDPGADYPWDVFLIYLRGFLGGVPPAQPDNDPEWIVDDLDYRPGRDQYPSPRSQSVMVLRVALNRHREWMPLPGSPVDPTLDTFQNCIRDFQTTHLGEAEADLIVGPKTKQALATEPRDCPACKRLNRYPYPADMK